MKIPNAIRGAVIVLLLTFLAPLAPGEDVARSRAEAPQATPAAGLDRVKLFDAVTSRIEQRFFDGGKLKEIDWEQRASDARKAVLAAGSDGEAVRLIQNLLAELKTSHTALITPDDYAYYFLTDIVGGQDSVKDLIARKFWGAGPFFAGIGAFTREIDGRHFVDAVFEASPADYAGLKFGDEIVMVDGAPYHPIRSFAGKIGGVAVLDVRSRAGGATDKLYVPVFPLRPKHAMSAATIASARVIEHAGKRIGYVHVWGLHDADAFKQALAKLEPAERERKADGSDETPPLDALIVDARGRVGGTMQAARQMLEALDQRGAYWGETRFSENPQKPRQGRRGERERTVAANMPPLRGRAILLVNDGTRSAGEIFAQGFRQGGFGTIVGTTTAGAVSAASAYVVPGDLLLYVAVTGLAFDGKPLEGIGVAPDHRVERPLAYAGGADPVLEAALDLAARHVTR